MTLLAARAALTLSREAGGLEWEAGHGRCVARDCAYDGVLTQVRGAARVTGFPRRKRNHQRASAQRPRWMACPRWAPPSEISNISYIYIYRSQTVPVGPGISGLRGVYPLADLAGGLGGWRGAADDTAAAAAAPPPCELALGGWEVRPTPLGDALYERCKVLPL